MHVTVIRPFLDSTGVRTEGEIITVSEMRAKELEKNGLIVPVVGGMHVIGMTTVDRATKGTGVPTSEVDPTPALPGGGLTGAEKPALSLPADLPPAKRQYRKRRAAQK